MHKKRKTLIACKISPGSLTHVKQNLKKIYRILNKQLSSTARQQNRAGTSAPAVQKLIQILSSTRPLVRKPAHDSWTPALKKGLGLVWLLHGHKWVLRGYWKFRKSEGSLFHENLGPSWALVGPISWPLWLKLIIHDIGAISYDSRSLKCNRVAWGVLILASPDWHAQKTPSPWSPILSKPPLLKFSYPK